DIYAATQALRDSGFANISFDLIAGLPHQTAGTWQQSLHELLELAPEHVSVYMLEIDEGSRLGRESLAGGTRYGAGQIPEDDAIAEFYESGCRELEIAGYEHYEISNWAKPGLRSKHNMKYWLREPYVGLGAGAHSFDGEYRWANAHDPAQYTAAIATGRLPLEQKEAVGKQAALDEELFLGLRLMQGIDVAALEARYNVALRARLEALAQRGLVELDADRARLAPSRLSVSNEVFIELLGDNAMSQS
ncbi:MAG: coproporphyrinogen-III oxidase family protein, partial [Bryobacteraceae bacterium]